MYATIIVTSIYQKGEVSEDCLYLTINVPSGYSIDETNNKLLPVMFWIHGGGFYIGAGNEPLYDAAYLSNATNTIVVSINYRLGKGAFIFHYILLSYKIYFLCHLWN